MIYGILDEFHKHNWKNKRIETNRFNMKIAKKMSEITRRLQKMRFLSHYDQTPTQISNVKWNDDANMSCLLSNLYYGFFLE